MARWTFWALGLTLIVAACTDDPEEGGATSVPETTTTEASQPEAIGPGRLAVVDSSGNIVVMDPDGANRQAVTEDGGGNARYTQPIWSPDATTLAWGQATGEGFAVGISTPGEDAETTIVPTGNLPFYMYWSPDGRNLGVLHNGSTGVAFQMVDPHNGTNSHLDEDAPFYFSWSPESDRVVTHAGVSRAETLSPDGERTQLEPTTGNYLAPQWTPNGVFHVVDEWLVLEDEEGERRQIASLSGLTMFVANPQGSMVALQTTGDGGSAITASTEEFPSVSAETVVVIDVAAGTTESVDSALALGFFWSPDGESLLVLTTSENRVVPVVWTKDGVAEFTPYQPSLPMLQDTFPFFPQYAQSVRFWAPDSTAFTYAGAVDEESGIWVQALDEEAPTRITDGVWVAWSPAGP